MKIAVVGASGRTGRIVVELALARGWEVKALVRQPESLDIQAEGLTVCVADVLDPERLSAGLMGCSAVISALGVGSSRAETQVYSVGVHHLLQAMQAQGLKRIAVISAAPVGPREDQAFLERRILMPILDRVFGATYRDMRRTESVLRTSDAEWTVLRPPRLLNNPATGHYRLQTEARLAKARSITCADLAAALLDCLENPDLIHRAVEVAN